ncbi:WXG100 family type VII secretion target [Nonomuraea roseola]|uniref:WXG100 family type VII secretion target n=1 Tax=Nonomuraea roseola TaxID=46179 RepID=A0ABV5PSH7_9ACTN
MAEINFFQASPDQLKEAMLRVVHAAEQAEGLRTAVQQTAQYLDWGGPAAKSFARAMLGWDDNMLRVVTDLRGVAETMGANAKVYKAVDDEHEAASFVQNLINR